VTEISDLSQDRPRKAWLPAVVWVLLAIGLTVGFAHIFGEMWGRWFPSWRREHLDFYKRITGGESYYTHAPLVPLLSLLIAVLLLRHTRIRVRPWRAAGAAVLILSMLLHLAACLARVNFASGFAFIGMLTGLVLLIWGIDALRRLWFPIALLFFMVPLPEVSIANLNFKLKMFAAELGVSVANGIGIPVERMGNRVLLEGDKTLVIANVCNGLRTLISLLAFGALYAYVCRLRGLWRIGLFLMSLPVAIVSNSLRIVSLILVAHIWDEDTATGWFHDWSGLLIFVLAFLLMFGTERLILWARKALGRPAEIVPLFHDVRRSPEDFEQGIRLFRAAASPRAGFAVAMALATAGGAWWLSQSIPPTWNERTAQQALPRLLEVDGTAMSSYDVPIDQLTKDVLETGDCLNRVYVAPDAPQVTFTIIFSKDNRKGTHPPDLCLAGSGEGIVGKGDVDVKGTEGRPIIPCREIIVQTGQTRQYHLYTYKCGGRYTRGFWEQQFTIFANGLLRRNASGALIRVSTSVQTSVEDARQRAMALLRVAVPHLDRKLN